MQPLQPSKYLLEDWGAELPSPLEDYRVSLKAGRLAAGHIWLQTRVWTPVLEECPYFVIAIKILCDDVSSSTVLVVASRLLPLEFYVCNFKQLVCTIAAYAFKLHTLLSENSHSIFDVH